MFGTMKKLNKWSLTLAVPLTDQTLGRPNFPYCITDLLTARQWNIDEQTFLSLNRLFFNVQFQRLEENVSSCVCGFTLNNCIIKHCALTPSTGHYNSDTSYNFSEAGKWILILTSKSTLSSETYLPAHGIEKIIKDCQQSFSMGVYPFFKKQLFVPHQLELYTSFAYDYLIMAVLLEDMVK